MKLRGDDDYMGIRYQIYRDDDYPYFYYYINPGEEGEIESPDGYDTIKDAEDSCIGHIERLLDKACGCDADYDISPGFEDHE